VSDGNGQEAVSVLAQFRTKLESLPEDLAAAVEGGGNIGEMFVMIAHSELQE
jgi:hypothetical protein